MTKMVMLILVEFLAIGYVVIVSTDDQTCPDVPELSDNKCCYALIDVINAARKQNECLKREIKQLKETVKSQVSDSCLDYMVSTLLKGNRSVYSASTIYPSQSCNCGPGRALLNTVSSDSHGWEGGAWSSKTLDKNQYLQIDLLTSRIVVGVATQGRISTSVNQWVTKYSVLHSNDSKSWTTIGGKYAQVFDGNVDQNTIKENMFENPVVAKYIRINPTEWNDHISMRADVIGCPLPANRANRA